MVKIIDNFNALGQLNLADYLFDEFIFAKNTDDRNGFWYLSESTTLPTLVEENFIANLKTNKGTEGYTSWELLDSEINEDIECKVLKSEKQIS